MSRDFGYLNEELAGIASRLNNLEHDFSETKRNSNRTPGGLLVPKSVSVHVATADVARLESVINSQGVAINKLTSQVADLTHLVTRLATVQARHQAAIEDLSLMSTLIG